jgi:hypothetical protein
MRTTERSVGAYLNKPWYLLPANQTSLTDAPAIAPKSRRPDNYALGVHSVKQCEKIGSAISAVGPTCMLEQVVFID